VSRGYLPDCGFLAVEPTAESFEKIAIRNENAQFFLRDLRALETKRNLLNHVAFVSDSFNNDIIELRRSGVIPLGLPKRARAFDGRKVTFFLTKLGFILELVEGIENAN